MPAGAPLQGTERFGSLAEELAQELRQRLLPRLGPERVLWSAEGFSMKPGTVGTSLTE